MTTDSADSTGRSPEPSAQLSPELSPELSPHLSAEPMAADGQAAARRALVETGGRFMVSKQMDSAAEPFGMKSAAFYFRGRVAALGEVSEPVAAATLAIFPVPLIELVWERTSSMPAQVALTGYQDACLLWGQQYFAGFKGAARLGELAAGVVDGCDASGLVLFSAWQSQPRPDDTEGHAAFAVMLLRELRGGLHFAALRAQGLDIPVAVLADPSGGVGRLRRTGWRHDQIDVLQARASGLPDLTARWQAAEAMTDAAYLGATGVLTRSERAELDALLVEAEAISR